VRPTDPTRRPVDGNVTLLCIHLGIPRIIAWMASPADDLSVTGLLLGQNALAQQRHHDGETGPSLWKPRLMLSFCGAFTLALNTADPIAQGRTGTACVDAVLPILLMAWSEVGPWMIREPNAGTAQDAAQPGTEEEQARCLPRRDSQLMRAAQGSGLPLLS